MNYVYDILVNFNENLYDFYDWNLNDPVTHIRRIPIYKVTSKQFYEIKNYQVKFDSKFLETIKNRTEFFSGRNIKIMKYAFLLTDGLDIMGIFIGDSIKYTSLQMDEELDILEDFRFKESHLDYQITSTKNAMILKTRYQIEQINKMKQKLNDLIKENNISKIQYIYYECFNEKEKQISLILERFYHSLENYQFLEKLTTFFEQHKQLN